MNRNTSTRSTKVPEVTLIFWIIKIAATTLGETGGDTVTMTLNWGYLAGTALFIAILFMLVALQVLANKFHPFLYWERAQERPPALMFVPGSSGAERHAGADDHFSPAPWCQWP